MNPNESGDSNGGKEIIGTRPEGKETIGNAPDRPASNSRRTITLVGGGIAVLAILAVLIALLTK
jgi:hypothetical protein